MNRTIKSLSLAVFILITGCTTAVNERQTLSAVEKSQDVSLKLEVLDCKEKGGYIKKVCMRGVSFCIEDHLDAGKQCSDSTECAGDCRIEKKFVKANSESSGFCSINNDPCGCFQSIEKGIAQPILCID